MEDTVTRIFMAVTVARPIQTPPPRRIRVPVPAETEATVDSIPISRTVDRRDTLEIPVTREFKAEREEEGNLLAVRETAD